jgi:hypothetical protein
MAISAVFWKNRIPRMAFVKILAIVAVTRFTPPT